MSRYTHRIAAVGSSLMLAFSIQPCAAATAPPNVSVTTAAELYAAVNDPGNDGAIVMLAPGRYVLDPIHANGGRLELRPDMTLRGQEGHSDAVIIDASGLPASSYKVDGVLTGAIRMGRGSNAVEWLTVTGATNGAANIDTDLPSATNAATVQITHVVSGGSQRGIEVRNIGAAQAHRILDAYLGHNVLSGNLVNAGQGLRVINTNGASGAIIRVTLQENDFSGNLIGFIAANVAGTASTVGSTIQVSSTANQYASNGTGAIFLGGQTSGSPTSSNTVLFDSHGDAFVENKGATSPNAAGGAILAIGGANAGTIADQANGNIVRVTLTGSRINDNQNVDIAAFGAQSQDHATPPGAGNGATVILRGVSKKATDLAVPSDPVDPLGTNSALVIR